ncbi:hypothetical protein UA08_01420 [Talaromyces atroroseus]|uniref:U4/U6.U5 small nuclear ribonucleoprotein 27kDa protein domain-containing protein n=1 Tax=Talaromyces atroroseus TaxID=1441469 RepID=A0A1Q5Q9K9_TALAT|nr:hypothetical protein UA08_01420 [Talaromyces atroroseus]OKL62613.1 hypothetical protein UA08_01420 [Talaromyces atroroseus]
MAEPPAKRARRTDSAAMWDTNEKRSRPSYSPEPESDQARHSRPEDTRKSARDDRRYRSRSRDRYARKRDRSVSRDRFERPGDHDRDGYRDSKRDGRGMRDRDRSSSRDRYYNRRGYSLKPGKPDRSRSPRNGTRSRRDSDADSRDERRDARSRIDHRRTNGAPRRGAPTDEEDAHHADMMSDIEDSDDIEAMMKRSMGFSRFRSTKNTKVPGNDIYGVRKEKKTEYRQYMNRVGGFNRPLSPGRG